jgi:hypothetical protein
MLVAYIFYCHHQLQAFDDNGLALEKKKKKKTTEESKRKTISIFTIPLIM